MSTQWVVTGSAERITLTNERHAEATFTVSNKGRLADRAVFDIVPGDGADRSWFTVEDPQRLVPATGSVAYLVSVDPPAEAPAGSYSLQGRVYSADSAPEEDSVLSGRTVFDLGLSTAPAPKPKPWWLIAVAALVVLVIGTVTWLVLASGGDEPPPSDTIGATPPPTSAAPVRMPNLVSLTMEQATAELNNAGLAVGTVKHQQNPAQNGKVLQQGTAPTTMVDSGSKVDLVVAVSLSAPTFTHPSSGGSYSGSTVTVSWNQTETWVAKWKINTTKRSCYFYIGHENRDCQWDAQASADVTAKTYQSSFNLDFQPALNIGRFNTGPVQAIVAAYDDFGNLGPSATVEYRVG